MSIQDSEATALHIDNVSLTSRFNQALSPHFVYSCPGAPVYKRQPKLASASKNASFNGRRITAHCIRTFCILNTPHCFIMSTDLKVTRSAYDLKVRNTHQCGSAHVHLCICNEYHIAKCIFFSLCHQVQVKERILMNLKSFCFFSLSPYPSHHPKLNSTSPMSAKVPPQIICCNLQQNTPLL